MLSATNDDFHNPIAQYLGAPTQLKSGRRCRLRLMIHWTSQQNDLPGDRADNLNTYTAASTRRQRRRRTQTGGFRYNNRNGNSEMM